MEPHLWFKLVPLRFQFGDSVLFSYICVALRKRFFKCLEREQLKRSFQVPKVPIFCFPEGSHEEVMRVQVIDSLRK